MHPDQQAGPEGTVVSMKIIPCDPNAMQMIDSAFLDVI